MTRMDCVLFPVAGKWQQIYYVPCAHILCVVDSWHRGLIDRSNPGRDSVSGCATTDYAYELGHHTIESSRTCHWSVHDEGVAAASNADRRSPAPPADSSVAPPSDPWRTCCMIPPGPSLLARSIIPVVRLQRWREKVRQAEATWPPPREPSPAAKWWWELNREGDDGRPAPERRRGRCGVERDRVLLHAEQV